MSELDRSLEELEVSVRTANALKQAGFQTLRDLVRHGRGDLLKSGFGTKSVREVEEMLDSMELELGMDIDD